MTRLTIVGGGLTGVLAAFQAHDLGCRDITLHERFDQLGGVAAPQRAYGAELRHACIYLGPPGDRVRSLLEAHGLAFDDFENHYGSVSLGADGGQVAASAFGGPVIPAREIGLKPVLGDSLAARIAAYPDDVAAVLTRYARWHLGFPLEEVHESAATPLGFARIFPSGVDLTALATAKRLDPLYDDLYALTRQAGGVIQNTLASEPRGGFAQMFAEARRALERLGVKVVDTSLVSPRQALAEHEPGRVLVWAANPTPLFKAAGLETPKLVKKTFATYIFKARWNGPVPFFAHNFTSQGGIFRLYFYRSGGETLLTAECVAERGDHELRGDIAQMAAAFDGGASLRLGELIAVNVAPRWIYHSVDAIRKLKGLRAVLEDRMSAGFVAGAWEPYAKTAKFDEVNAALARTLGEKAGLRIAG